MTQYIDKDALVAEIENEINKIDLNSIGDWRYRLQREHDIEVMKNIISFINTLEVKEVDFERELSKYVSQGIHRFFPNEGNDYYNIDSVEWQDYVIDTAKHFFELGLKVQKGI